VTGPPTSSPDAVLYRGAALADGRSDRLALDRSVLVQDGRIRWIRPGDDEQETPPPGTRVLDATGATLVPGMVDSHVHVTLPGGARWIERTGDDTDDLVAAAEHNAGLMRSAGVRWGRDVGSPRRAERGGRERALALTVRDAWRGTPSRPRLHVGGTWVGRRGMLPDGLAVTGEDGAELEAAALAQVADGADLVKLYLDGRGGEELRWNPADIVRVVDAVHAAGARVTAHAMSAQSIRDAVAAGIDAIEHGDSIDPDVADRMAAQGTFLVSTLSIYRSWQSFGRTTSIPRFAGEEGAAVVRDRFERASHSVLTAHRAGVRIAAGTDAGGGSTRANHLAWEVENLVHAGLQPWEALGAATWRGGELLGEPEAGVLTEGGPADFFLVHGDPLSDPTALWRVWRVAW
jgi:imidazolonepropionase-like amidohydrolase